MKSKTAKGPSIRAVLPVTNNWFIVTNPESQRWFIERAVALALVDERGRVDTVRGISSNGMPTDSHDGDHYLVFGDDKSPTGKSWREVYDSVSPSAVDVREISHPYGRTIADEQV